MYIAKVYVTLKPTVNDPQGLTVLNGLKNLGFDSVSNVRMGKYVEIFIQERRKAQAEIKIRKMCDKLLTNPVIEEYRFELIEAQ
jgi:phosphoribosylformylglycinamidine synthase PurS subunit